MNAPAAVQPQLDKLKALWGQMAERERIGVLLAGASLGLLVGVLLLVNPALKTLRESPAKLAQLDQELARMQGWAAEAQRLQGQPAVNPAQVQAALQAATEALGPDARLTVSGDRATLNFSNLSAQQLGAWLAEVRSAARARAIEANLQRGPRGYGGSVVLSLGAAS